MKPISPAYVACMVTLLLGSCAITVIYLRETPLPDFSVLAVAQKKAQFFAYLRPKIERANADVLVERQRLLGLAPKAAQGRLNWLDRRWLSKMGARYELSAPEPADFPQLINDLLQRVDMIPPSLALIQAAKESAWGTSRFAVHGNNLFGQHCFAAGCGHVPLRRDANRRHEVAQFASAQAAVVAYLHNLNTHPRYAELRDIRARIRAENGVLHGTTLADGLLAYSERGAAYISEVKAMIRANNLE